MITATVSSRFQATGSAAIAVRRARAAEDPPGIVVHCGGSEGWRHRSGRLRAEPDHGMSEDWRTAAAATQLYQDAMQAALRLDNR